MNWLKHLFGAEKPHRKKEPPNQDPVESPHTAPTVRITRKELEKHLKPPETSTKKTGPLPASMPNAHTIPRSESDKKVESHAEAHLRKLSVKLNLLARQFASGEINRKQFEELYSHYQREIGIVEQFMKQDQTSSEWQEALQTGKSVLIRRLHSSKLLGFSIYDRSSGMPLKTTGSFGVDPSLFVPMLFAYQSATREIFGSSMQSTMIEDGQWLCFARGAYTTTVALFSTEPSGKQLRKLEGLQKLFEDANRISLAKSPVNPDELITTPYEFFLTHPF